MRKPHQNELVPEFQTVEAAVTSPLPKCHRGEAIHSEYRTGEVIHPSSLPFISSASLATPGIPPAHSAGFQLYPPPEHPALEGYPDQQV